MKNELNFCKYDKGVNFMELTGDNRSSQRLERLIIVQREDEASAEGN